MTERKREIQKELWKFATNTLTHKIRGPVCMRCFLTFWFESIVRDRNKFQIVFPGKYCVSFWKRAWDWIIYYFECFKIWYIQNFEHGFEKTRKMLETLKKNDFDYMPSKPVHVKLSNTPDEIFLYAYLESCGLKITEEEFDRYIMVYDVEVTE